jgi:hypothetical protein
MVLMVSNLNNYFVYSEFELTIHIFMYRLCVAKIKTAISWHIFVPILSHNLQLQNRVRSLWLLKKLWV